MSQARLIASLATVTLGVGCLKQPVITPNPASGVEATGEPLRIDTETRRFTYVAAVADGETRHLDAQGHEIGRSQHVRYEERTGTDVRWAFLQGDTPVDEQDFFRIAGDRRSFRAVRGYRQEGQVIQGGAIAAATFGLGLIAYSVIPFEGRPDHAPVLVIPGVGVLGGSVVGYFFGKGRQDPAHRVNSLQRAREAAQVYNETLEEAP